MWKPRGEKKNETASQEEKAFSAAKGLYLLRGQRDEDRLQRRKNPKPLRYRAGKDPSPKDLRKLRQASARPDGCDQKGPEYRPDVLFDRQHITVFPTGRSPYRPHPWRAFESFFPKPMGIIGLGLLMEGWWRPCFSGSCRLGGIYESHLD